MRAMYSRVSFSEVSLPELISACSCAIVRLVMLSGNVAVPIAISVSVARECGKCRNGAAQDKKNFFHIVEPFV